MNASSGDGSQPLAPAHVAMIQKLVADYCLVSRVEPGGAEARDAAKELLRWFQAGETDATRLRELLYSRDPSDDHSRL